MNLSVLEKESIRDHRKLENDKRRLKYELKRVAADHRNKRDSARFDGFAELIFNTFVGYKLNLINSIINHSGKDSAFRYAQKQRPDLFGKTKDDGFGLGEFDNEADDSQD